MAERHPQHLFVLFLLLLCSGPARSQNPAVTDSLNKIAGTASVSGYFGLLYYKSTLAAEKYAAAQNPAPARFLTAFESGFAHYFFEAVNEAPQPASLPFSWQRYYSRQNLNAFQYYFLGMNAHINGDMWQALVKTHPYDSIKKYRQLLLDFQHPLTGLFDSTYRTCSKYKNLSRFHRLTLGLDKWYGKRMMLHWRSNQIKLALLSYSNTARFSRRLKKTHHKMKRLDAFVIKWFG